MRLNIFGVLIVVGIFTAMNCILLQAQQASSVGDGSEPTRSGSITGRVVNESGQPLSNALVFARAFGSSNPGRNTFADAEGNFQLKGLDTGLYSLSAFAPAYVMPARDPKDLQDNLLRVGDSVKLTLFKGAVLTGTVTNSAGEPVIAVPVHVQMVRDAEGKRKTVGVELGARTTDDRGIYRIYGLQPGTYVVFAGVTGSFGFSLTPYNSDVPTYSPSSTRDNAAEITLRSGDEITGVDIRYRGEPGHVASGSVIGTASPETPGSYMVNLAAVSNGKPIWSNNTSQPPMAKGFAFDGLADGEYDLWSNSFITGEVGISEPRRIRIKGADVTGIELTTKPLASVSGRLILEASKDPACKDKRRPQLAETLVYTQREDKPPGLAFERFVAAQGSPRKDGDFALRNLAPGQYFFSAQFYAKYWYLESITLPSASASASATTSATASASATAKANVTDAASKWTALKLGDRITGLDVKLAEGAASLRGRIAVQSGESLPAGMLFYLVPAEREKTGDALHFYASRINDDGTFTLNNLAPGRYWSIARTPADNELPAKLSRPDQSESRLRIRREAELAKHELELKPCENKTDFEWRGKEKDK